MITYVYVQVLNSDIKSEGMYYTIVLACSHEGVQLLQLCKGVLHIV